MTYHLSTNSLRRLNGVHPDLVRVVKRAIEITEQDFAVVQGRRTIDEQKRLYGKGRTSAECAAKGVPTSYSQPSKSKVTWTLNSNHLAKADGYGHAVDLAAYDNGIDWDDLDKYHVIAEAMKRAASECAVHIEWGGDWRKTKDLPHYELA